MSPYAKGRHWSPLLLVLVLLAALLGFAPAAHATTSVTEKYLEVRYDCLEGQTVTVTPGQAQIQLADENGILTGPADLESAELWIWPKDPYTEDGVRHQVDSAPAVETNFQPESGMPLNDREVIGLHYLVRWSGEGEPIDFYGQTEIQCVGQAADTDGDGVIDEVDACPNEAASGVADGCPSGVSLSVLDVQPGDSAKGVSGTAIISVTNLVDGHGQEQYQVWNGSQDQSFPLNDGDSTQATFTGVPGDWQVCARSSTREASSCTTVTVPDYVDPHAGYAGKVVYTQTCRGLRYTITNTGTKTVQASVRLTSLRSTGSTSTWSLAPGASRTVTTPRYFNATVRPTLYGSGSDWSQVLTAKRWVQPRTCPVPMIGGTKLVKWGPRVVRSGYPYAVVRTRAYHAVVGYQIKGRSKIHWVRDYDRQGRHRLSYFMRIKPHKRATIRLWVIYKDDSGFARTGKTAFTRWHTFRRP